MQQPEKLLQTHITDTATAPENVHFEREDDWKRQLLDV